MCLYCNFKNIFLFFPFFFVRDLEIFPFVWQKLTYPSPISLRGRVFPLVSFCRLAMCEPALELDSSTLWLER